MTNKYCQLDNIVYRTDRYGLNVKVNINVENILGNFSIYCPPSQPYVESVKIYKNIFVDYVNNLLYKINVPISEINAYQVLWEEEEENLNFLKFYGIHDTNGIILEYLHSKDLMHSDLHGSNILWDYNKNRIVIIDLEDTSGRTHRTYDNDNEDMAFLLWSLFEPFSDDVSEDIQEDIELYGIHDSLIRRINKTRHKYQKYNREIDMILDLLDGEYT